MPGIFSQQPTSVAGSNASSSNSTQGSTTPKSYTFQHQEMIDAFTPSSAARLARIKRQSQDGWLMHILTAGWYGLFDQNIRNISTKFRQTRAGSKSSNPETAQRFDKDLKNLRGTVAIILKKYGYASNGQPTTSIARTSTNMAQKA